MTQTPYERSRQTRHGVRGYSRYGRYSKRSPRRLGVSLEEYVLRHPRRWLGIKTWAALMTIGVEGAA